MEHAYEIVCNVNGRIYSFIVRKIDGGVPYGFCKKLRKWGWIHDDYIQLEDGVIHRSKIVS